MTPPSSQSFHAQIIESYIGIDRAESDFPVRNTCREGIGNPVDAITGKGHCISIYDQFNGAPQAIGNLRIGHGNIALPNPVMVLSNRPPFRGYPASSKIEIGRILEAVKDLEIVVRTGVEVQHIHKDPVVQAC